jgi:predicted HicB family RNase H-like nuclease
MRRGVTTPGRLGHMPNAPGTTRRTFRINDELYNAAKAAARERGQDLSAFVRDALQAHIKRTSRPRKDPP